MVRISGSTRRIAASILIWAVAAPFFGVAPSAAVSTGSPAASIEAACPPPTPGTAECLALVRTGLSLSPAATVSPLATPTAPYTPANLQSAYSLPTGTEGSGLTVAVVDAYDLSNAESYLATYRSHFGLPACTTANGCFKRVDQNGGTNYPATAVGTGWDLEIALDIDMVSAVCPYCHILLVEAKDSGYDNLGTAVNTAVALGAVAVSNSYAGPEASNESSLDSAYYNHPGVAITASTGDCGYDCTGVWQGSDSQSVGYPAASPDVVAVGGTSLVADTSARGWSETAWGNSSGGAGSGCSAYEPKPSWQQDTGCTNRTEADVSAVADPNTGVYVYEGGSWYEVGGTSASSPIIAATFALAGGPAAGSYPASYLYGDTAGLNDVVGGNNDVTWHTCTVTYFCNGVAGYDGPTGLGTPNGLGAFTSPSATVPGAPTAVTATRGNAQALVSWTAPASNGGSAITGYTVASSPGSAGCTTTGALSCTVSGLSNGQPYTFTVTATNGVGTGPASSASNSVTPATVPGSPTGVTAAPGNAQALVSWTAPASNGGSAITGYTVASSPGSAGCTTTGALSCTVSGLTNGQPYTFTVTATNAAGTGLPSSASSSVTPATVPGAPTAVTATRGNAQALVSWTAPASNGGSAITGYTVASSPGSAGCTTTGALSCTVSGLSNGQPYTFTVTATNGVGTGPASSASNSVTPATVPGSPTGVTAAPGNAQALVSWTAPASNGGSAITGYTVASSPGSAGCTTTGALSCTVSGLTNGQPYTFTVTATNAAGTGLPSSASSSVTPIASATHLGLSGLASPVSAGAAGSLTVTALDGSSNTATGYRGTVHFTSSDPKAVLPANYTFTSADAGVHVFSVTLKTFGSQSVTVTDAANATIGGSRSGIAVTWPAASFYATSPRRILDTRATVKSGNPTNIGLSGVFKAGTVRRFSVAGAKYVGGGTAPAVPANAVAVSGNLTVVGETAAGVIDLGPAASASGTTSTLSFLVGDTRANNVTVGLAADGSLAAVYRSSTAGATANLIFDVTGYFLPGTSGASYHTVTPGRILDTRPTSSGTGATHIGPLSKLPNRTVRSFPVAGVTPLAGSSALVPSAAVAVTGNLTVTDATSLGYAAIGPTMTASPSTSTVNVAAGTNVANGVTVALYGGKLSVVWCGTTGSSADVIFDVTGFFTAGPGGLSFYALAPVRLLDSSLNTGLKGPFTSRSPQLFGVGGTSTVPSSALAIAGNLTLLSPTANGWALVSPAVVSSPTTSTVNASKGHSEANGFDVALGSTGQVALEWAGTTGSTANLALDVTGYWK